MIDARHCPECGADQLLPPPRPSFSWLICQYIDERIPLTKAQKSDARRRGLKMVGLRRHVLVATGGILIPFSIMYVFSWLMTDLDAIQNMLTNNAGHPTAAIMAPRTLIGFEKLKDGNQLPLKRPKMIEELPFLDTTSVPIDDTQGTSSDASKIILGNFPEMIIGVRQELVIDVLKERYAEFHQIGFVAHLRADVHLIHEKSFAQIVGVTP